MSNCNKTLITFLFVMLVSFLFQGIAYSQTIPFDTIDKGDYSYYKGNDPDFSGAEMVIRDWKTWAWFWKKHTQGIQPLLPLPKVDFRTEMVVAAILGYQTSGGGPGIEISSVEAIFGYYVFPIKSIRVFVKENRTPGPLDVITNPYYIVKVAKSNSVIFDHGSEEKTCVDNAECAENQFCLFSEGKCSGPGACTEKPKVCPLYYGPVCGCDMNTYGNPCEAYANGASILYAGECK